MSDAAATLLVVLALTAKQLEVTGGATATAYLADSIAFVRLTGCGGGGGIDCTSCSAACCCCCCWSLQEATGVELGAPSIAAAGVVAAVAAESQLLAGSATRLLALPLQCCAAGVAAATVVTCRMRLVPAAGVLILLL
jgi:hypothetical protein